MVRMTAHHLATHSFATATDRVDQIMHVVAAIRAAADGLLFIATNAVHVAARPAAESALGLLLVWLLIKLRVPGRLLARRGQIKVVRIDPPAESAFRPEAWVTFHRAMVGMTAPWWKRLTRGQASVVYEFHSVRGLTVMHCWYPREIDALLKASVRTALPGADIVEVDTQPLPPGRPAARSRLRLWRDELYPLGTAGTDALADAVAALAASEEGVLQIAMSPDTEWEKRSTRRFDQLSGVDQHEGLAWKIIRLPLDLLFEFWWEAPKTETRTAPVRRPKGAAPPSDKAFKAGWRAEVRICSWDARGAAAGTVRSAASAFNALDGDNHLRPSRVWWPWSFDHAVVTRQGPGTASMVLVAEEVAQLCHLPLDGVAMDEARVRMMPAHRSSSGQDATGSLLCRLDDQRAAPVTIRQTDRRQHVHIVGPTGSGKSTLLLNLALQDIDAGIGLAVVDPKGDLIRDLLQRIPEQHANRVVLIDPSHRDRPVGLNVLECEDEDRRELVADSVVTVFRKSFERFWGPRTDDVLRAALLTLLRQRDATLCEVPLLLLNREVRARLTRNLGDPIGLKPFWQEYEAVGDAQRLAMVGPVLNKLRTFLVRPTVRNVLGQSRSTIDIPAVMDNGGILLVNLAKGLLGEDTSRLLGSFVVSRIWHAALTRTGRPEAWRPDFNLYLDEFQNYLHLPQSIDDVLAEARAYRLNLTLAHQHLAQLHDSTREALASNARTRIAFQAGQDDARYLAREFEPMTAHQLQALDRYQVAVRLCVDGRTERPFTGTTVEAPPSAGDDHARLIAESSLTRYGRPVEDVEAEILRRRASFGDRGGFKEIA